MYTGRRCGVGGILRVGCVEFDQGGNTWPICLRLGRQRVQMRDVHEIGIVIERFVRVKVTPRL